jgi:hypothetical protein
MTETYKVIKDEFDKDILEITSIQVGNISKVKLETDIARLQVLLDKFTE